MLRQAANTNLRQHVSRFYQRSTSSCFLRSPNNTITRNKQKLLSTQILQPSVITIGLRSLSSQQQAKNEEPAKANGDVDDDPADTKEIVLTPGQKVAVASRLTMWAGIFTLASACAYYIGKELIPTKMSPNSVFNGASKIIRENSQVTLKYGDSSLKFYGKDHGGHREGEVFDVMCICFIQSDINCLIILLIETLYYSLLLLLYNTLFSTKDVAILSNTLNIQTRTMVRSGHGYGLTWRGNFRRRTVSPRCRKICHRENSFTF